MFDFQKLEVCQISKAFCKEMKTSRRDFISTAFAGGIAATIPDYLIEALEKTTPESRYAIIDKIMKL